MPWQKPYHASRNQRLDPQLYTHAGRVCFITIRAFGGQSPFVREGLNALMIDSLKEEQSRQDCIVFTYCLMPDHLHYLISPRQDGVSVVRFTDEYKGKTTNRSWSVGWRGKLWQPRFYDHIVRTEEDLRAIEQYIVDNPVRRALVVSAEEWPWSAHLNPLPL